MPKKICFIMDASPEFLGGTSIYVLNFIKYLKKEKKDFEITCIFPSKINEEYVKEGIKFIGLKNRGFFPFNMISYTKKVARFLRKNNFDAINSQAMAGNYLRYFKPNGISSNTYHGVAYYFYKSHLKEKSIIKKIGARYYMFFGRYLEKPPIKKADKIIGVSSHVLEELNKIYGKAKKQALVRSSVNLSLFKKRDKLKTLKELKLDKSNIYEIGRGLNSSHIPLSRMPSSA